MTGVGLAVAFLVGADELGLCQHMAFHRGLDLCLVGMREIERGVERIELVEIAVPSDRRARAAIGGFSPICGTSHRAPPQPPLFCLLRKPARLRRDVWKGPNSPNALS